MILSPEVSRMAGAHNNNKTIIITIIIAIIITIILILITITTIHII